MKKAFQENYGTGLLKSMLPNKNSVIVLLFLLVPVMVSCRGTTYRDSVEKEEVSLILNEFSRLRFEQNLHAETPMNNKDLLMQITRQKGIAISAFIKRLQKEQPQIYARIL